MMVTLVICIFVTVVVADFLISHFSIFVTCFHLLFPFLIFHKYNINNYIRPKNFESRMWITFLGTCISLNQNSCNIILIYIFNNFNDNVYFVNFLFHNNSNKSMHEFWKLAVFRETVQSFLK